jgi:hypothetical protein
MPFCLNGDVRLHYRIERQRTRPAARPPALVQHEFGCAFERVKTTAARVPHATFVSFPGVDHGNADRLDLVLSHLTRFLAAAEEAPRS